jgi:hypothetical protein
MDDRRGTLIHDAELAHLNGYRVEAPEGQLGIVQKVLHAGRPPRPLTLVVSDGGTIRLVSLHRVAEVASRERRIILRPERDATSPDDGCLKAA